MLTLQNFYYKKGFGFQPFFLHNTHYKNGIEIQSNFFFKITEFQELHFCGVRIIVLKRKGWKFKTIKTRSDWMSIEKLK